MKHTASRICLVLGLILLQLSALGEDAAAISNKANALYYKLTGTNLLPENPLMPDLIKAVTANDLTSAAHIITDSHTGSRHFYDNVVKMFALPFNRTHSTTNTANDLVAFIVGSVRDGHTIDEMLTGNYYYSDTNPSLSGEPGLDPRNDNHFDFLDKNSSFRDRLVQQTNGAGDIGLFTTRGFASDFYSAGTNRRPWKAIVEMLYCVNQTAIKTLFIPTDKVRRDVPRQQNGSVTQYETTCRGCHAQMDPISNAFGLWDFPQDQIVRQATFTEKINEPGNYPTFKPSSDQWWLYYTDAQDPIFGFKDVPAFGDSPAVSFAPIDDGLKLAQGKGLKSFARVVAASSGFAHCMATRIVTQMYLKKVWSLPNLTQSDLDALATQNAVIDSLAQKLMNKRTLKETFEDAAIQYLQ